MKDTARREGNVKRLIVAALVCLLTLSSYSCAYKCVTVPPPGGYSYGQAAEKGEQGDKK
jgi:hypothetical protein